MKEGMGSFVGATQVEDLEEHESLEATIERAKEVQAQIEEINQSGVVHGPVEKLQAEKLAGLFTQLLQRIPEAMRRQHGLPDPGQHPAAQPGPDDRFLEMYG